MAENFPMIGGDGLYSYANNSTKQKEVAEAAKSMLIEGILENLDIENIIPSTKFTIADFGCSVGPNTFISMDYIIEGVTKAYKIKGNSNILPEFQVYFNDHVSNDFNTLFANLPSNRKYFGVGVPGSFHGRLFPKSSLNVVYCAIALHWLSRVPQEFSGLSSPICNTGRIHYANAPNEIVEAYFAQFAKDMNSFLGARAKELTPSGLMTIIIPGRPNGTLPSQFSLGHVFHLMESCLLDMANEGIISKDEIDSFNLPLYSPSAEEVRSLIEKNGHFGIKKLEEMPLKSVNSTPSTTECRCLFENLLKTHFGSEKSSIFYERYDAKFGRLSSTTAYSDFVIGLFILLKRHL